MTGRPARLVDVLPHGVDIAASGPHRRSPEMRRFLLHQKRVQQGLADARQFTWPKVTERYFRFYGNLVRARPGSQNVLPAA